MQASRALVMLRLVRIDAARLWELVTDAWRMRGPDPLVQDPRMAPTPPT
ncbi:MAG TPA: hypothetical protein VLJ59_16950 [Mycobacteriales bacterium]|nr:hypothetical protein [Mycobacteriales bacterium]